MRPNLKSICIKAEKILEMDCYDRDLELSMIWFLSDGIDKNVVAMSTHIQEKIDIALSRYPGWNSSDFKVLYFLVKGDD